MKKTLVFSIFLLFFLIACGHNDHQSEMNFLDPIEVELIPLTELEVNKEIVTQVIVTQNEKTVSDAEEVVFEIWQHGHPETYRSLDGVAKGDGIYEVSWSATEEGVYYVFYHVTANGMHRMEKHQLVIGDDVDVEKILASPDERPKTHMH
ncbi:FixH family protein [Anaerobacillus sp. CMMVII]|uniref:FixH family protein n=1 Tax=Anaerobacillus sp. CMMVII TaxID=2755588 RepID=UPI0021B7C79B|nr:FixH family protein [Anaerobacillus sp. CMMVII]MCT8140441.1 FixH family protein [Anaerobacillus sp. CMMVII]